MNRDILDYFVIRKSGLFDSKYYLETYPDVRRADLDPYWHYVKYGWREGRNPSRVFDGARYLEANPDVKNANLNPLVHYQKYGKSENRKASANGQAALSTSKYTKANKLKRITIQKLISKTIIYINIYGFRRLIHKIATFIFPAKINIYRPKQVTVALIEPVLNSAPISTHFDLSVSVIIPTKDAGDDFGIILKMYRIQKGFENIEVIIVDSGSTDNTLKIAKEFNSKIITILPEEFSHSYARNLGAENATGDFLLFTVQDALPPNEFWLSEMMSVMKSNKVKAVSCAEYPRENADLFYRAISWNHYNFLGVNSEDRIYQLPENPNYITFRQNGQLSDLACLIPNEVFKKYKYRLNYAEDLDLGIRLIKDGEKIAFLGSIRIIHSHNRPPYYFLKRGYVDNLFLSDLFADYPVPAINITDLVHDIIFTYHYVVYEVCEQLSKINTPIRTKEFNELMGEMFFSVAAYKFPAQLSLDENFYLDRRYLDLLMQLINLYGNPENGASYNGYLIEALYNYSNIISRFLEQTYEQIDKLLVEDYKSCLYKELSQLIGAHLAYCYRNSTKQEKKEFEHFHLTLKAGI